MTPLQRYYFGSYLNCAVQGSGPASYSEIRWLYKTAAHRKQELATNPDVVPVASRSGNQIPVRLSFEARNKGWISLTLGPDEWLQIVRLEPFLQNQFYDGQSLWKLMLTPLLFSAATLLFLLAGDAALRGRRESRRWSPAQTRWREPRPNSVQRSISAIRSTRLRLPKVVEALARRRSGGAILKPPEPPIEPSRKPALMAYPLFGATGTTAKRFYVIDESSLASTRQLHEFVHRLHPNDRVLLVGDRRQHEGVEAGRPFAQLQDAGMVTVKLDEIVRQKDPELKRVVEQLARGEVREAIQNLEWQGRVHEIHGHEERITAIAKEYAKSPESTLVVSPDNRSRVAINERVHAELQRRGTASREEHSIRTLVPRQDLTGADRTWAERYEVGDVLRYSRASKETGIGKGG